MSTKSKKTTVTSSSINVSSIQTPQSSSTPRSGSRPASSAGRSSSPMSPTRQTRLQEKADLQNLNDRLAAYIDRVRHLEGENSRLTREIQSSHETVTREVTNIKGLYESELSDARKLLDETAREKAKLEIDMKRIAEENDELVRRLDKKVKDLASAEGQARLFENRANEFNNKYNNSLADKKKIQDELQEACKELDKLRKSLAEVRKAFEEETLCRIDLENMIQSFREDQQFKDQVYQQELTETRSRRQVDISEIDGRLAQQYEAKLQQSLQELREQQESQIKANKDELENRYDAKIKALQQAATRNSTATGLAVEELRQARLQVDSFNTKISQLEQENTTLNARIRELEKILQTERARHAGDLAAMEVELARLRDEMADQLKEYASLMDIKIGLDMEISTYRALLEGEEDRLNLTQDSEASVHAKTASVSGSVRRTTPLRTARKRMLLEESEERSVADYSVVSSAKGDIEITEVCPEGKFVKLHNKGKKEISLSGWQVVRRAGNQETQYRFHRSVKLEPGTDATIWSSDAGHEHEPPHNLVMKGQRWFVADNMTTVVVNNNQEEVAASERQRRQLSTSAARHREMSHKLPRHDLGELAQGEEKCSIM